MVRDGSEGRQVLLVRTERGAWGFPKGHLERGETQEAAAEREVLEETNIHARVVARAGDVHYFFRTRRALISKVVHLFLMR